MSGMPLQVALIAGGSLPIGNELSALLRSWLTGGVAGCGIGGRNDFPISQPSPGPFPKGAETAEEVISAAAASMTDASEQAAGRGASAAVDPLDWADVQDSQGGDHEAYARLVRRHQQTIAAYMWRFTRQPSTWEELVHDVFVEAYLGLRGYQGRAPFLHWLRRIATRVGYRHWKSRRRLHGRETQLDDATADAAVAREEGTEASRQAAEVVHGLLARLAPRDRLVMTLMYLEQCTTAEIAQRTGWSESLVKVQAFRARRRLRRICEQEPEK